MERRLAEDRLSLSSLLEINRRMEDISSKGAKVLKLLSSLEAEKKALLSKANIAERKEVPSCEPASMVWRKKLEKCRERQEALNGKTEQYEKDIQAMKEVVERQNQEVSIIRIEEVKTKENFRGVYKN